MILSRLRSMRPECFDYRKPKPDESVDDLVGRLFSRNGDGDALAASQFLTGSRRGMVALTNPEVT